MKKKKSLSAQFCEKNGIAVISETEEKVEIGFVREIPREVYERLERYYLPEKTISISRIKEEEFEVIITRLYSGSGNFQTEKEEKTKSDERSAAKAAPAVNLLNSIISEGILKKATDIHINITKKECTVRYRKDGKLHLMLKAERVRGEAVVARIKLLSDLNILEHRRCQDGRFDYVFKNSTYDLRVSVISGIEGESVVLRILGGDIRTPELEELGFTKKQLCQIRSLMKKESGLVLAAGPTGSGKTTTLASIISEINRDDINIITVEDPVEYRIKNVVQVSVEEEIGKSFAEVLKRILRHDPDILMVGEIRDEETAAIACRMALTGHLVFASIHTANCEETPLRLVDMGVPSYIVGAVLRGVISQRLVEKKGGGRTVKADIRLFENQENVRTLCMEK